MKVNAIIWNFDGTLVDSGKKNYNVTRKIINSIPNYSLPFDLTVENHQKAAIRSKNWRELYLREYGMDEQQTNQAGMLWTQYQLEDTTPITLYPGLNLFLEYTATIPQGIVSQNSRQNIIRILKKNKIDQFFTSIIGYEEVDLHHQKPHPEGILNCLHEINITEGNVFYVGDHETDINTAKNAAPELKMQASSIEILTIAAYYGSSDDPVYWQTQPDFVASKVADFNKLIDFKKDK